MSSNPVSLVDFAPFEHGTPEERKVVSDEIERAFQKIGFVCLKNSGIPVSDVQEAFDYSEKFFALPREIKALAPHPPGHTHHRGWSAMGEEKISQHEYDEDTLKELKKNPDVKETMDMGNKTDKMQPNIWLPEEHLPGFRTKMEAFFQQCDRLIIQVLRALAIALELPDEDGLSKKHSKSLDQLRLNFYPSVKVSALRTGVRDRCTAHSDFGTLTLLFQDSNGGLEVEDPHNEGSFLAVPPVPDTVIVNCGDLMIRWSNGRWRSGVHRVVAPPVDKERSEEAGEEVLTDRYSIPFFAAPDPDALIEPLPGCFSESNPKKFDPITTWDYVMMRMAAIR